MLKQKKSSLLRSKNKKINKVLEKKKDSKSRTKSYLDNKDKTSKVKNKIAQGVSKKSKQIQKIEKRTLRKVSRKKVEGVVVDPFEKIQRVPSYISNLDGLMQGGFIKNTTNLIVGGGGSGKTIFAMQFLIGAMEKKEKCLYITFEEKKQHFYKNMLTFGWDLSKFEKQGLFYFLEYTPEKVKMMLEEGGGAVENIVLSKQISRLVIDSIASFTLLFENELLKRESSIELFSLLRKWNCTSLLTDEENPRGMSGSSKKGVGLESDSIIHLHFIRKGKTRQRFLEIYKMRGTDHSKGVYPVQIGKKGFNIKLSPLKKF